MDMNTSVIDNPEIQQLFHYFGGYSLGWHMTLVVGIAAVMLAMVVSIVAVRGGGRQLKAVCVQNLLAGFIAALSVIALPAFFFFVARAFWLACMADPCQESE